MRGVWFITGTDTGVGKTHVSCALLRALRARGVDACGYKPVASGGVMIDGRPTNEDVLALAAAADGVESPDAINAYTFLPPIAPHLAAVQAGVTLERSRLDTGLAALAARHQVVIVEGAGGWQVPLSERLTFADWVTDRQWPVILVVAIRLGCINHALLSAESIARRTRLAGWIANRVPPDLPEWTANVATLRARLPAPLLACLPPRLSSEQESESAFDLDALAAGGFPDRS